MQWELGENVFVAVVRAVIWSDESVSGLLKSKQAVDASMSSGEFQWLSTEKALMG